MTPDIIEAKILEDYRIYLKFATGEEKIYDMKKWIYNDKNYSKLKDETYFKDIKVTRDTIEWKTGEDIAPEYLYHESIPIEK